MPKATPAFTHPFGQRLRRGRAQHLIWLALGMPVLAEIAARQSPDALVIDMQHGLWERQALESAVGLASAYVPVVVRSADFSPISISIALDSGASAVMAPLVQTVEDAQALVRAGRYPPLGERSGGGVRPLARGVAAMQNMGQQVALGAMIETAQGLANADAICATPGIDFIFIGTVDLALSLADASGKALRTACLQILEAAQRHRLPCGLFTPDAAAARKTLADGYTMAVVANDIDIATRGFANALAAIRT